MIFACDGLKDYVSEMEIIQIIKKCAKDENLEEILAEKLVKYALESAESEDNITVLVVRI